MLRHVARVRPGSFSVDAHTRESSERLSRGLWLFSSSSSSTRSPLLPPSSLGPLPCTRGRGYRGYIGRWRGTKRETETERKRKEERGEEGGRVREARERITLPLNHTCICVSIYIVSMPFTLSRRRLLRGPIYRPAKRLETNPFTRRTLFCGFQVASRTTSAECRLVEVLHISLMNISTLCPSSLSHSLPPFFSLSLLANMGRLHRSK